MASPILITGATGFIGRHLTRDLAIAGHSVRILARDPHKARFLFGDNVEVIVGNLKDPAALKKACAGVQTVYHLAAIYRFGLRRHREIHQTNIEGTENLFQAAVEAAVKKIVHVSSASVLGKTNGHHKSEPFLDETDFPANPPRFSPYKFSKWEAENRVLAWVKRGLPVVIANPSCPIGSGDEAPTPTGEIIRDFIDGRFPCYCQAGLNFVNVADVSTGLQLAAKSGRLGERYLLTHENLWLKEFLDRLAEQTGLPAPRVCLPQNVILTLSCFGEIFDYFGSSRKSARICLETALKARSVQFFNNAKAREELGWKPTSIQSGIQQALAWYQHESVTASACASLPVAKSHVR